MIVIGVSGFAKAGKDTFVGIAIDILKSNGYCPFRVAFADKLKSEVQSMLTQYGFKLDLTKISAAEKERIRPLFVFWGCQRRYDSPNGMYWINSIDAQLRKLCEDYIARGESHENVVALVSDCRFPNEAKWIHDQCHGSIIHIRKYKMEAYRDGLDGSEGEGAVYDPAPNAEEATQDPLVQSVADVHVEWEDKNASTTVAAIEIPELKDIVLEALNKTTHFKLIRPITGRLIQ